jgi:hypothetical protein
MICVESVQAAAAVASPHVGIANLMIHSGWIADYILDGKSPAVGKMVQVPSS